MCGGGGGGRGREKGERNGESCEGIFVSWSKITLLQTPKDFPVPSQCVMN